MDYFNDLSFVCHGEVPDSHSVIDRADFEDYWGLQYSHAGKSVLGIGDGAYEYVDGACVFVSYPGVPFHYGAAENGPGIENKLFVCFRGDRVRRYLAGGLLVERRTNALIPVSDAEGFLARLRGLRALLTLPRTTENHARAVLALESILLELASGTRIAHICGDPRSHAFRDLAGRIAAVPEQRWNFEREARRLGVSYAHFRRLFERIVGMPPGAFVLESRLQKAAALLSAGSEMRVCEAARACGFKDEFYFSRIFRKHRGFAPGRYRDVFAL